MIPLQTIDGKVYIESNFVAKAFKQALNRERIECVKLVDAYSGDSAKTIFEIMKRKELEWEDEL
jgi:hypothetical protein